MLNKFLGDVVTGAGFALGAVITLAVLAWANLLPGAIQ